MIELPVRRALTRTSPERVQRRQSGGGVCVTSADGAILMVDPIRIPQILGNLSLALHTGRCRRHFGVQT
jgi:hypothetical protein